MNHIQDYKTYNFTGRKKYPPHSSPQRIIRFTAIYGFVKPFPAKTFLHFLIGCRGNESCIFFCHTSGYFYLDDNKNISTNFHYTTKTTGESNSQVNICNFMCMIINI